MSRWSVLGWIVMALATIAIAAAPEVLSVTTPTSATVVDQALFLSGDGPGEQVSLPHVIFPGAGKPQVVRYLLDIDLPAADGERYLLFPLLNRHIALSIAGEPFYDSVGDTLWAGPMVSTTRLVRLPRSEPGAGDKRLTLTVFVDRFIVPFYLSPIYFGTEAELAPSFKARTSVEQLKIMNLGAQLLLAAGMIVAFFFRPRDALISWLAALEAIVAIVMIGMFTGFQPGIREFLPLIVGLAPGLGLLSVVVALILVGVHPSRVPRRLIVATTCLALAGAAIQTPLSMAIMAVLAVVFLCLGTATATGVIVWGALRRDNIDARIMLGPALLVAWFMAREAYIVATLPAHAFNPISPPVGLIYVAALASVLMRRMGAAFDLLDRSNETLTRRLAEREAELAVLARQEQVEVTQQMREQERQRLTHDLHDGLSGHLVSIIALSERAESKPIEAAAREALDDLRLVIYSLDLDDSDLPLALANFRERLVPQLQRLDVELDWSMVKLPEVRGVTPGNALAVLRILQEAITNALRHGPARHISIRGHVSADGLAAIVIENDGNSFSASRGGRGMENMRRRAEQLKAKLHIVGIATGTEVTLLLPLHLANVET